MLSVLLNKIHIDISIHCLISSLKTGKFNYRLVPIWLRLCEKEPFKEYSCTHQPNSFMLYVYNRKEMFYLMMHSTHFIYGYMASDIW